MSIAENLLSIKNNLPEHVALVAVSKTKPISDLMEAYDAGQRILAKTKFKKWRVNGNRCPKIFSGT
jgi:uncharacterized pyridoxal phosphate-containing UPF0001 family protein